MGAPLPIPGLSAILCGYAKFRHGKPAISGITDPQPSLVAVIPALNEERTIPYAIVSLAMQTVMPDRLVVINDGSTDETAAIIDALRTGVPFEIEVIHHENPHGKTPSIKEVARAASEEKLFILDADTYLESESYIEEVLRAHAREDIACAFGRVKPATRTAKKRMFEAEIKPRYGSTNTVNELLTCEIKSWETFGAKLRYYVGHWPVEQYRDTLYRVEQGFVKDAYMRLFDTAMFPVGCGVLYDRERLVEVFDAYEDSLGDNLTNSEDIFLGFAFAQRGLTNLQVDTVSMRTTEPSIRDLPKQSYLWGSAYLQSAYYFTDISTCFRTKGDESRHPYGRAVATQLVDGLYPTTLLLITGLFVLRLIDLEWLVGLLGFEFGLYAIIALAFARDRIDGLARMFVWVPVRLLQLPIGIYIYLRVSLDIVCGTRNWRK